MTSLPYRPHHSAPLWHKNGLFSSPCFTVSVLAMIAIRAGQPLQKPCGALASASSCSHWPCDCTTESTLLRLHADSAELPTLLQPVVLTLSPATSLGACSGNRSCQCRVTVGNLISAEIVPYRICWKTIGTFFNCKFFLESMCYWWRLNTKFAQCSFCIYEWKSPFFQRYKMERTFWK
jgi:hypothetical protein